MYNNFRNHHMRTKLLHTSPQAPRITLGYYNLWFTIYGATNKHPMVLVFVFCFKRRKQHFLCLSVDWSVGVQYNCRRLVSRLPEELLSVDPHQSDRSSTVCRQVSRLLSASRLFCRRTDRKLAPGSPHFATPWIFRHHLFTVLGRAKMPSKNKNRSMATEVPY